MIHNARQYRLTKAQAAKFAEAVKALDVCPAAHMHPKLIKAQRDALTSQFESSNQEISEYDLRKSWRQTDE